MIAKQDGGFHAPQSGAAGGEQRIFPRQKSFRPAKDQSGMPSSKLTDGQGPFTTSSKARNTRADAGLRQWNGRR